jgi:hypothetical protein
MGHEPVVSPRWGLIRQEVTSVFGRGMVSNVVGAVGGYLAYTQTGDFLVTIVCQVIGTILTNLAQRWGGTSAYSPVAREPTDDLHHG